jgi:hypothetical protein
MIANGKGEQQFALCHACADRPEVVRAFAAHFVRGDDPTTHIREANRFLATLSDDRDAVRGTDRASQRQQ